MNTRKRSVTGRVLIGAAALLFAQAPAPAGNPGDADLAQQIFDTMIKVHGVQPGFRPVHAKGVVCQGTFEPSPGAAGVSRAAHFRAPVPVTVRFSDGATDPMIPDNAGNAGPRGMAVRFLLPGGAETDIVAMSHNGFVVATGEEFLALQKAVVATDPSASHPWPVEQFLGSHPLALKFVTDNAVIPASLATEAFFGNHAFVFVDKTGTKRPARYKILPVAGQHDLALAEAAAMGPDFLIDDLRARLVKGPVKYRLVLQFPAAGDRTDDPSLVWPDDRATLDAGTINVASVAPDGDKAQRALAFDPTNLTDGIEPSDDRLPALRSEVYALSVKYRRQQRQK